MRRTDLIEATMAGSSRLDAVQRDRFFETFLKAALRLDRLEVRAWLRRRLQYPPLVAPIDPASLLADVDIALLLRAAGKAPGEAAAGPDRDEADDPAKGHPLHAGGHACRNGNTRAAYEAGTSLTKSGVSLRYIKNTGCLSR